MTAPSLPGHVVSLALFRHHASAYEKPGVGSWRGRFFALYLPVIVRAYRLAYPGWEIRIHHDSSVFDNAYGDALFGLANAGLVNLVHVADAPPSLAGASLWRMMPLDDPSVSVVVTRDVDSLPTHREAAFVREFLASDAVVQSVHDSPAHDGLMTGMLAFKVAPLRGLGWTGVYDRLVHAGRNDYLDFDVHETDQIILNRHLLPSVRPHLRETKAFRTPSSSPLELVAKHMGSPFDHLAAMEVLGVDADAPVAAVERFCGFRFDDPPEAYESRRRVVVGVDRNATYAFFLPIFAKLWGVLGYKPEALLVGSRSQWCSPSAPAWLALVARESRAAGANLHFLGDDASVFAGFQPCNVAQTARLVGGSLPGVADDAYVLTGDVDMLPMPRMAEFLARGGSGAAGHLFYANAYAHEPLPHFPLCYVGMARSAWRSLVGDNGSPSATLFRILNANLGARAVHTSETAWHAWNFDEKWLSLRLSERKDFERFQRVDRDPSRDRVDRAWWDRCPPPSECVDCHALRPGFDGANWPKVRDVLARCSLLSPSDLAWVDAYRARFVESFA